MHVQYGSSFNGPESWVNFDASPTLLVERIPVVGQTLSRLAKRNPTLFAPHIRYGNILRGLPIPKNSADAVYASHVLEHLTRCDVDRALRNTIRIMKPGAVFRLIVPDLEVRAERYLARRQTDPRACDWFLRSTLLGIEDWPSSRLARFNLQVGVSRHLWMWDFSGLRESLEEAGFIDIRRCTFGDNPDPKFADIEDPNRFHDPNLDLPELAIEARKPR